MWRRVCGATTAGLRAGRAIGPAGVRVRSLKVDSINPAVLTAEYAVRGELVLRAAAIKQDGFKDVPFDKLLECNIGNPQAVGQQPLSFGRQVLSLMCCPQLLELPGTADLFA